MSPALDVTILSDDDVPHADNAITLVAAKEHSFLHSINTPTIMYF